MKWIQRLIPGILILLSFQLCAQPLPLRVAIEVFEPPFVMQAANNQVHGFDISLILTICRGIGRTCQFQVMPFNDLLAAVENNEADVAISAITITVPRARRVNFSLPYLSSVSRFLTTKQFSRQPFTLQNLNNKRIGVEQGSIFAEQIVNLGIGNATVVPYETVHELIDSLNNNDVDLVLMDNHSAVFWEIQSSGLLKTYGMPLEYGFGYGIAINRQNNTLLSQINTVLLKYQQSEDFKKSYRKYFGNIGGASF